MGTPAIYLQIEADAYNTITHETFGHLFPQEKYYWEGTVRIAYSIYGGIVVLDEQIDIEGSPWWYSSINEFAVEMTGNMEQGEVYEFAIAVKREHFQDIDKDGDNLGNPYEKLVISLLKTTKLVGAL